MTGKEGVRGILQKSVNRRHDTVVKILTRVEPRMYSPPMFTKIISKMIKPVSVLMVAAVLSTVGIVAFHHHDRNSGAEDNCSICFVGQVLASSSHSPVVVAFAKPDLSPIFQQFRKIIPPIKTAFLNTHFIHGPPLG